MAILSFSAASAVRRTDRGWAGDVPEDWGQGRASFGGLLAGMALRALGHEVHRPLRSMMTTFVAPVAAGEVSLTTRLLRSGRALTQASAELWQDGEVRVTVVAAYGASRATAVRVAGGPAQAAPAPEELPPLPYLEGVMPRFTRGYEFRYSRPAFPYSGGHDPSVGGWVRQATRDPVDAIALVGLLDAWPAPVLPLFTAPAPSSTVTWMVNLAAEPPAGGWSGDAWWRYEAETLASGDGYADALARLWTADGVLVGTSHQLVAEFSAPVGA